VSEEITAFADAMIFDGVSAELREGCVRVAAGMIASVSENPERGDRVIDCRGRTVVPGLIDAHLHAYGARLSLLEIETSPLSYLALAGARRLAGALGRGFTTVRDPGGGDAGLAQAIREGLTAAPRYLFCGAALSQTGGHGDPRPPELGCCLGGGHMAEVVDGVDALRRAARERLRSGAHAIKIMASGGVISPSDPLRVPQYSPEEIRVVAEEAGRRGSYVAAHAYSAAAIGVAVANGVRSIEHGNLLDAPTAALMAERGAFLVPTLVTYDAMERRGAELGLAPVAQAKNREVLEAGRTAIGLAREAGVRIGFGTDLMGALDDEQLHGLRLQAEVEGPLALLRAATSVNAELLGRDDLGRIGPGATADLLVLDGDPLRDPSVLWGGPDRRAVFQGGVRVAEQDARLVLLADWTRAAVEDLGETAGGGGEIGLVPGPQVPAQMGEADVQLVAVMAGGGVEEGAGQETAPGGVEKEVAAHRALPGEHRLDLADVWAHQHVGVQQVAVDQVPALRAGIDQGPYPFGHRRREGGQLPVGGQAGAPSVDRFAGVIDQATEEELAPAPGGRGPLVPEHQGLRAGRGRAHLPDLGHRQVRAGEGHGHPVGFVPGHLRPEADHQLVAVGPVGPRR
jgi:imidazolonepropionase-like amidohydrolase